MNRHLIACALAACGVPQRAVPGPEQPLDVGDLGLHITFSRHVEPTPPPRPLYAATRTPLAPPAHVITGLHSGQISALAVTTDGTTAVTADVNGAVRLWPTLDGTREPVVVTARAPRSLAIARDGDELVIAGLDAVGQLELVRATATGREDERIAVDTPRPLIAVRAVASWFVAVRDDQAIVAFDVHGALAGELMPDPGERIVTIEVEREHALAVVVRDRVVRGRWLDLSSHFAWGARTARLAIDPARALKLSPSGTRLAAVSRDHTAIQIVELATGKVVAEPYVGPGDPELDGALAPLAFADDTTLAVIAQFATQVWHDGALHAFDQLRGGTIVGVAGMFVVGSGDVLAITTGDVTEYVGYQVAGVTDVIARPDGLLATDTRQILRIDRALHADRMFEIPDGAGWHVAHLLDARHALVYANRVGQIVDLESDAKPVKMPYEEGTYYDYQPKTQVLALRTAKELVFAHFDSKTGTFDEPLRVTKNTSTTAEAFLLDPDVASGHVAAIVEPQASYGPGPVEITEVRFSHGKLEVAGTRWIELAKPYWEDREAVATAIGGLPRAKRTNPRGDLIAAVENRRLVLRTAAGVERWSRRLEGTGIVWSAAGELFVYGSGMARIDLDTGALADRQCGWQFGRYPQHTGSFAGAALCDASD